MTVKVWVAVIVRATITIGTVTARVTVTVGSVPVGVTLTGLQCLPVMWWRRLFNPCPSLAELVERLRGSPAVRTAARKYTDWPIVHRMIKWPTIVKSFARDENLACITQSLDFTKLKRRTGVQILPLIWGGYYILWCMLQLGFTKQTGIVIKLYLELFFRV